MYCWLRLSNRQARYPSPFLLNRQHSFFVSLAGVGEGRNHRTCSPAGRLGMYRRGINGSAGIHTQNVICPPQICPGREQGRSNYRITFACLTRKSGGRLLAVASSDKQIPGSYSLLSTDRAVRMTGCNASMTTVNSWFSASTDLLEPLYERPKKRGAIFRLYSDR